MAHCASVLRTVKARAACAPALGVPRTSVRVEMLASALLGHVLVLLSQSEVAAHKIKTTDRTIKLISDILLQTTIILENDF